MNAALSTIVDKAIGQEQAIDERLKALRKRMSGRKKLNLPKLLERRRQEYSLTDGFFKVQAAFDRCYVYQIPLEEQETHAGGLIIRTANQREREQNEAPRGILISAGLKALDALRSNGVDLGHIITFAHYVVATMVVDVVDGKDVKVSVMNAGHVSGSEDTRLALLEGRCRIEFDKETGQHFYAWGKAKRGVKPIMPWMSEDI
jgi:hypothetical protein